MTEKWDWQNDDVPTIEGKIAIVTGAASGLGAHIAEVLCIKGASVVIADLNVKRAEQVAEKISSLVPDAKIYVKMLDLADSASIEKFATWYKTEHSTLDILINNAGIMTPPYGLTAQGFELQLGINHLGHFSLVYHLFPALHSTPGSRLVTQTSIVHRGGKINFKDINSERSYSPWKAYKQSKLAALLFSRELDIRMKSLGIDNPISISSHPGLVNTDLYLNRERMRRWLKPFMHNIEAGAMPVLRATLDPMAKGGQSFGTDGWMEFKGKAVIVRPHGKGKDMSLASKVWEISEDLTGLNFSSRLNEYILSKDRK